MSSILQYLLLLGFSWNVCQMCSLISNVARSDMWEIKYFDQCCAIDVSPTFHGNLDFSPRFSFIFAEACTLDKQDYHFISKCTSHSSIDLYAFVLADTQQKTVKNTGCGFFRWWRGWLGQYLREGGCKFQIHLVIRHLLACFFRLEVISAFKADGSEVAPTMQGLNVSFWDDPSRLAVRFGGSKFGKGWMGLRKSPCVSYFAPCRHLSHSSWPNRWT